MKTLLNATKRIGLAKTLKLAAATLYAKVVWAVLVQLGMDEQADDLALTVNGMWAWAGR